MINIKKNLERMGRMIYLDNAATTMMSKEAIDAMLPYFDTYYGNPSSIYELGTISKEVLERGRRSISKMINCKENEIYFTSGGTEADNFAIKQVCEACKRQKKHIITTKIEHHAVLHSCMAMERNGVQVTYVDVDSRGRVKLNELENAITNDTILISVMHANNEIGTVEPLERVGGIAKKYGIIFHTDAVQSFCHIPIDVRHFNVDILSASSHKFGGPKGVGFMYVREGLKLNPFMDGGSQEMGLRAGTGNAAGIAGMTAAAQKSYDNMRKNIRYETRLRDYMIGRLVREIPGVSLNGHPSYRLPNNINISISGIDGGVLMVMLDLEGICVSTGSACTQSHTSPSHVLLAIGLDERQAGSSVRITLSEKNTAEEINRTVDIIKREVAKLREKA